MSITASELYRSARAKVGMNFQDGRLDENNVDGALTVLNGGLMEFSLRKDWDFLYSEGTVTTANNTTGYALPSNHLRTLWLALRDEQITQSSRAEAIRWNEVPGEPQYFSILGNQILLHPIPDGAYTLRHGYYRHIPRITATTLTDLATVTLAIPAYYETLAALYVAKHICLMFKDYDAYKAVENEIRNQLQNLEDNALRSLSSRVPQTRRDG